MTAVVDTSFWGAAAMLGTDAYLYGLFGQPLWMPQAAIDEVFAPNPAAPARVYPRQARLRLAIEDRRVIRREPARSYGRFGRGEAACIGLAIETGCTLLLNDRRPYLEAIRLDLTVLNLPDVIALLAGRDIVAGPTALAWLDALRDTVSDTLVDAAADMVRGGRRT